MFPGRNGLSKGPINGSGRTNLRAFIVAFKSAGADDYVNYF
jgi:hypothetical protein